MTLYEMPAEAWFMDHRHGGFNEPVDPRPPF